MVVKIGTLHRIDHSGKEEGSFNHHGHSRSIADYPGSNQKRSKNYEYINEYIHYCSSPLGECWAVDLGGLRPFFVVLSSVHVSGIGH